MANVALSSQERLGGGGERYGECCIKFTRTGDGGGRGGGGDMANVALGSQETRQKKTKTNKKPAYNLKWNAFANVQLHNYTR